jgi:endonuclease YncB( thermonuclease family)
MASGQTLTCEANGKSYDRVTAWCRTPAGLQLNCAMVRGGYALRWDKFDPQGKLCN